MTITCIWDGHNTLGESPVWDHRGHVLYWIDIEESKLHGLDPKTSQHKSWGLPAKPGSIGLNQSGGLVAALNKGFAFIDLPSGYVTLATQPIADREDLKFNDGKCDRQGRFWAGTSDINETSPIGGLYRFGEDGKAVKMDQGFTVANGLGWNLDNTIMYFTDSPERIIYQYDFEAKTGNISNRRPFVKVSEEAGFPDGLTVDSEGYIWSAHWDGWRITRYSPQGKIDRIIKMPVQRPSSVCFGGPNLDILYVTSAIKYMSPHELAKGPQAGNLFAIETGVKGLPEPMYRKG